MTAGGNYLPLSSAAYREREGDLLAHKENMTAQLLGAIQAQGALVESLVVSLCRSKVLDAPMVDTIFAHARAQFAQPYMAGSGGRRRMLRWSCSKIYRCEWSAAHAR